MWKMNAQKWAAPVLRAFAALDALDAKGDVSPYDEKFRGVDLHKLWQVYQTRFGPEKRHARVRSGVKKLLRSIEGLHAFAIETNLVDHPYTFLIEQGLLEAAAAMIEGRSPNYSFIQGFDAHLDAAHFKGLVGVISPGWVVLGAYGWKGFWADNLPGCDREIFFTRAACPWSKMDIPPANFSQTE